MLWIIQGGEEYETVINKEIWVRECWLNAQRRWRMCGRGLMKSCLFFSCIWSRFWVNWIFLHKLSRRDYGFSCRAWIRNHIRLMERENIKKTGRLSNCRKFVCKEVTWTEETWLVRCVIKTKMFRIICIRQTMKRRKEKKRDLINFELPFS